MKIDEDDQFDAEAHYEEFKKQKLRSERFNVSSHVIENQNKIIEELKAKLKKKKIVEKGPQFHNKALTKQNYSKNLLMM